MDDPPLILVSKQGNTSKLYECDCASDCASDCACAQQNHAPMHQKPAQANSAPLQRSAQLTIVPVDAAHQIAFHQTQVVGPVLVNRSARAVLDFFTRPDR